MRPNSGLSRFRAPSGRLREALVGDGRQRKWDCPFYCINIICNQNLENQRMFTAETAPLEPECWDVEQRSDGAVLVRVHSNNQNGRRLPDAVFTFRSGDPQYRFWEEKLRNRNFKQE